MSKSRLPASATPKATENGDERDERDEQGRFAEGNRGGPGNPYVRQVAALRKAFLSAVTEKDMADIAKTLIVRTVSGDMAAAKLVLSYVIGKPAPAPSPDRMDVEEMQQVLAEHDGLREMRKLQMTPEPELPLNTMRIIRSAATQKYVDIMRQGIKELDERDKQRQQEKASAEKAPKANGSNGQHQAETAQGVGIPQGSPLDNCLDAAYSLRGQAAPTAPTSKGAPSPNGSKGVKELRTK